MTLILQLMKNPKTSCGSTQNNLGVGFADIHWGHLVSHHHFPCLNSYTGFQLITESNSNCPLLHIVLLQYINHLILQVSCTF